MAVSRTDTFEVHVLVSLCYYMYGCRLDNHNIIFFCFTLQNKKSLSIQIHEEQAEFLYLDEIVIIFAMTVVRILDNHLIKRTAIVNVSSSTWAMLLLIADGYLSLQFMFFSFFV